MKKLILISALLFSFNGWAEEANNDCADKLYQIYRGDGYCRVVRAVFIDENGTEIYVRKYHGGDDLKQRYEELYSCKNVQFKPAFSSNGFPKPRVLDATWNGQLGKHVDLCAIIVDGKDYYPPR